MSPACGLCGRETALVARVTVNWQLIGQVEPTTAASLRQVCADCFAPFAAATAPRIPTPSPIPDVFRDALADTPESPSGEQT